ncbi:MAG: potassium/proton antiporter [Lachnospiraceae bacterium]
MTFFVLVIACVILLCVLAEKFSDKFGMPALILFMFIGMLFGSDGIFKIPFDNFVLAENICAIALIFIMFYGGFNTNWPVAKKVAGKSVLLSTAGVLITALITAFLCNSVLKISPEESFLIGAVLSSTDAASVFAILRKKKLDLMDGTASVLEVESGSNDPVSYMLAIIALGFMLPGGNDSIALTVIKQVFFGVVTGIVLAKLVINILTKTRLVSEGLDTIFIIAVILSCFGINSMIGGNSYLSIYLFGIILGNSRIQNKQNLIPFFDGVTSLAQISIFFLIGLLSFPHLMPAIIPDAVAIVVFLTIIARPVAVFGLLLPFKCSVKQCLLVSWAGLRGASSVVFAIMAVANGISMKQDLYHIVFMVSLFSVSIQGTLLPAVARRLGMVDEKSDVRKTFNDYQEETALQLMRMHIPEGHNWENKRIREVNMPTGSLAIMIKRENETIITKGDTEIFAGDDIILTVPPYEPSEQDKLEEHSITRLDPWCNKAIGELDIPEDMLIAMIVRDDETVIPNGQTVLKENDIIVMYR